MPPYMHMYVLSLYYEFGFWNMEIGCRKEPSNFKTPLDFDAPSTDTVSVRRDIYGVFHSGAVAPVRKTGAVVSEYSVAPCYMSLRERGAHEWIVEFEREPDSLERFAEALDGELRAVNSDYDAKRRTTLERQRLTVVERGRFLAWMRARGKNKVPRLVNDRRVADEILAFQTEQTL